MPAGKFVHLARLLAVSFTAATASAQQMPRSVVVLDPAHGNSDAGAHLTDTAFEKDANLALAGRLRKLLAAQGFTVVLTREADAPESSTPSLTSDQRAEIANHNRPLACLILHTTKAGHGVHLFTSALIPLTIADQPRAVLDWNTAQAASIPQSLRLVNELSAGFNAARIPLVVGRTSIQPIDSLVCPAVAIELSPLLAGANSSTSADDDTYQQNLAEAIASALVSWRSHNEPTDQPLGLPLAKEPKAAAKPTVAAKPLLAKPSAAPAGAKP